MRRSFFYRNYSGNVPIAPVERMRFPGDPGSPARDCPHRNHSSPAGGYTHQHPSRANCNNGSRNSRPGAGKYAA
jgi:hypothetical protein